MTCSASWSRGAAPLLLGLLTLAGWPCSRSASAEEKRTLHRFERIQLTDVYYSEGAGAGDIDGDGKSDIVYGPFWFAGPDFQRKGELYAPVPQPTERYADNFFSWVRDFDGDGDLDVFVVGFPGTPAYVYENPGPQGLGSHWKKHQVIDAVANESPHFVDIVGDDRPELVCTREGFFGYATIDWERPFEPWVFHAISDKIAPVNFGHGLGVGDVSGDGRADLIFAGGWLEQPETDPGSGRWRLHPAQFTDSYGGAEMYAYDVDGDGDNDVITSLAAHDFGLAWYEQVREGDSVAFKQHKIMGDQPDQSRYGLVFTELHSVNLADIDGDGLKDIVTGKTYWSHHRQSPLWDAGAVVYWFRLQRTPDGVDWVPYRADGEAGIGRQLGVQDLDGDGDLDLFVGGMKGSYVLRHTAEQVSEEAWQAAQPVRSADAPPRKDRGAPLELDAEGKVAGAIEGEGLRVVEVTAGKSQTQAMTPFAGDGPDRESRRWSGGSQLFWIGGGPDAKLVLEIEAPEAGKFEIGGAFTLARDYATIRVSLDDQPLAEPLDLFDGRVRSSGLVSLGERELSAGPHRLTLEIVGANPAAVKAYMVGLDCLVLRKR